MSTSRGPGVISNNESSWRKLFSWCGQNQIDLFCCSTKNVVNFQAQLFDSGFEFRTIGSYRSAILAFHQKIDRASIGEHPSVSILMKRTWMRHGDIDVVLSFIKTNWGLNTNLSLIDLTYKLTMLLALTIPWRVYIWQDQGINIFFILINCLRIEEMVNLVLQELKMHSYSIAHFVLSSTENIRPPMLFGKIQEKIPWDFSQLGYMSIEYMCPSSWRSHIFYDWNRI